jgi:peptidyl-prolyl cis-trans isomerase SurA
MVYNYALALVDGGEGINLFMIKRIITAFLCATCWVLALQQSLPAAILLDRVVAVVNSEVITWSELYSIMAAEASDRVRAMDAAERNRIFRSNEAEFLERLIDMRLQIQEARRLGLQVREDEVKEAIENIKKKYQMTDSALDESLKKEGLTLEEYKQRLSDQILVTQFVNQQIRRKVVVTDEQIQQYMKAHRQNPLGEDEFRLRQIFFRKPKDDAMREALEEKAAMVVQRLKDGEDFATLAWEYSEDTSTKIGGDLGYLKKSDMAKEFVDVLTGLQPGEVSRPFWTEQGLHIVRLEDRVAASLAKSEKEDIRRQLEEEMFAEKYKIYLKNLREKARIEIRL